MGLLGKILKITIDVATTPLDIAKDIATLGGSLIDEDSSTSDKARRLARDLEELRTEIDKL